MFVIAETSRECFVNTDGVTTFDGLTVAYTPDSLEAGAVGCEMLIAQDCGSRALFAVTTSGTSTSWKMRILVPGQEIEYIRRGSLTVRVNGEERNLLPSQSIVIRQEPGNDRYPLLCSALLSDIELCCV